MPAGFCLEQVAAPFFCFTAPSPIGSSRWSACDSCGAPATRCWRSIFERTAKAPAIESRWASSNPGRAVGAQVAPRAFARRTRGGARDIDGRLSDAYRTADRGRRRDRRIRRSRFRRRRFEPPRAQVRPARPALYAVRAGRDAIACGIDASKLRPIEGIARLHTPIFIMTGAEDQKTTVPRPGAVRCGQSAESYWETPGAPSYRPGCGRQRLSRATLEFLDAAHRSPPDRPLLGDVRLSEIRVVSIRSGAIRQTKWSKAGLESGLGWTSESGHGGCDPELSDRLSGRLPTRTAQPS